MVKCVNEIIHICEVCIKKEAKRKEAEGRVKTVPARLEGTTARNNGSNSIPGINTNMYNVPEEPVAVVPGGKLKDVCTIPLVWPRHYTSEQGNMCNEHHPQFVGSPFPKSVPVTPQPMGASLLSQWFGSEKFNHSTKIPPGFLPHEPDLCSTLDATFGPVQKMDNALQCFWVPETEDYLVWWPQSSMEWQLLSTVIY